MTHAACDAPASREDTARSGLGALWRAWRRRRALRRAGAHLGRLDDNLLRDIGLHRGDIDDAVRGRLHLRGRG